MDDYRICIIEPLEQDATTVNAARKLKDRPVFSSCGFEYLNDPGFTTYFIVHDFEGPIFESLCKSRAKVLGPTALIQLAAEDAKLPQLELRRPLHNHAMRGAIVCFTGYRTQSDHMNRISRLVYHMGGRVRREPDITTTHLIAHHPGGEKFEYAAMFKLPILSDSWVSSAWERRFEVGFSATSTEMVTQHKLKLGGTRICFLGFTPEWTQNYKEYVVKNNGLVAEIDDPLCTHLVVNDNEDPIPIVPDVLPAGCCVVKSGWFWKSMETEVCKDVKEYLLQDTPESGNTNTPGSAASRARKRKRLQQRPRCSDSPATGKRRSSAHTLDFSGNFLDWTLTPDKEGHDVNEDPKSISARKVKFLELVSTESNYVDILKVIVNSFKAPLEAFEEGNPILDAMELKMIFGNLPPIVDAHSAMLEDLKAGVHAWSSSFSIGKIILNKASDLQKAYPPFINYFEKSKETLEQCENSNPRFHAFLKLRQSQPECGRQTLKELLIRPVQRLPSVSLLLGDLLKHTEKNHPDHGPLEKALAAVKEVMTHINEDKRRTEQQVAMLDLFNDIENCPPDLISSHRSLIAKCECLELTDGRKGDPITLLVFTDTIEICCKRRAKAFATLRGTKGLQKLTKTKQLKHLRLLHLTDVHRVIDVRDGDECQTSFALRLVDDAIVRFSIIDENITKPDFLKILCQQLSVTFCTTDPDRFLDEMDKMELGVEHVSKGPTHSLTKALKFASNAKVKMGRALSLSRTPSRASRMSRRAPDSAAPSPAISQLAHMRIQSCANLNDSCASIDSILLDDHRN